MEPKTKTESPQATDSPSAGWRHGGCGGRIKSDGRCERCDAVVESPSAGGKARVDSPGWAKDVNGPIFYLDQAVKSLRAIGSDGWADDVEYVATKLREARDEREA